VNKGNSLMLSVWL